MKSSPLLASGFALALSIPAFASAASVAIPYGDLDFSRINDIATFNARVEAAAKMVCADFSSMDPGENSRFVCRSNIWRQAVERLPAERRLALRTTKAAPIALAGGKTPAAEWVAR